MAIRKSDSTVAFCHLYVNARRQALRIAKSSVIRGSQAGKISDEHKIIAPVESETTTLEDARFGL
ncbi:hypothetical protein CTI12_AA529560 [Artemisia annua]|uniref:Uncharacterized protein n=1 Tax=Artemisia annua TaxID=35608 RepID=A0A2U1L461_ARTAN|nr:hypothetical protein CTI12_AA529560 [Artemisia annua]